MANINIIDTGYVNLEEEGTQESLIANSGGVIELRSVNLTYQRGQNVDDSPFVGREDNSDVSPVSTSNPIIQLSGVLKRNSDADMNNIILFDTLNRSKGVKLLYYDSVSDDFGVVGGGDGWNMIVNKLGQDYVDGNTNQAGETVSDVHTQSGGVLYNGGSPFPHLHVLVVSINIVQNAQNPNLLNYTMGCVLT